VYVFEGFRLDAQRRVLHAADGEPIPLTPRLFDTLLYFVERSGQLLTKEQLMEALWPRVVVEEHNLNKTVSELRRVLGEKPGEHRFIVTKPGHGYRFVANVSLLVGVDPDEARGRDAGAALPAGARRGERVRRVGIGAALAAGATVIGLVVLGLFEPATERSPRITPWSVKKGIQWSAVWSADGESTAFATFATPSEPAALHIRALNEPSARPVVRRPVPFPWITQWTSDGRILFLEGTGLWSVSPVSALPEHDAAVDWRRHGIEQPMRQVHVTRDGSSLAAVARGEDGTFGVWSATPPSAPLAKYEPAPFAAVDLHSPPPFLRFSPDGKQLLLMWFAEGRGEEAWLMPFPPDANHPPRRVLERLPMEGDSVEFSWFPDNRHVAVVVGSREHPRSLYVADTRSGRLRELKTGVRSVAVPVVSPDGSKLLLSEAIEDFDIVTLDLRTATVTTAIATDRSESQPSWATDANAFVYVTDRSGELEIWLHRPPEPDGPLVTARDFPAATLFLNAPTLSPDGSRLIYYRVDRADPAGTRLWQSRVAGGAPERLTNEEVVEAAGSWSPDGVWYAYLAAAPDGRRVLKRVKTTGRATPETLLDGMDLASGFGRLAPIWSPDNRWLLFPNRARMTLLSLHDMTTRDLGIAPAACAFSDVEPLLNCILGTQAADDWSLVALDLHGQPVRSIGRIARADLPTTPLSPGLRLSPTPDGLGVTYSVVRQQENLWLMEGLDRIELP
jgi:DNA-binding winged helix-turn-helix (wHTH) protein/Tol biopolymer transport system component